MKTATIYRKSV